ncbi:hypothetical protein WMY93_031778, partial [Mugilogobius chulae]
MIDDKRELSSVNEIQFKYLVSTLVSVSRGCCCVPAVIVNNILDDSFLARDFHSDDLIGREMTFDILYHDSEHQATMLQYGVKKSS